jgi:hypothetical protein
MNARYILSDYIDQALAKAVYDKLDDDTFAGQIPMCKGVVAFAQRASECEQELHAVLEDWILLGFKLKHRLPIVAGINSNEEPGHEPLVAVQTA